jgi:hypothetical protein
VRLEKALPLRSASRRDALKIARHFSAGNSALGYWQSPVGTIENPTQPSLWDSNLLSLGKLPALKCRAWSLAILASFPYAIEASNIRLSRHLAQMPGTFCHFESRMGLPAKWSKETPSCVP